MKYQQVPKKLATQKCFILQYFFLGAFCLGFLIYSALKITNLYGVVNTVQLSNVQPKNKLLKFLEVKTLKLENILEDDESLKNDMFKKVFFLETHMGEERVLNNTRHACSVEAAARTNPDTRIYLIMTTNSSHMSLEYSDLAKVLLSYENIHIKFLNPYEFSKGTVLENFIKTDAILKAKYPIEHMADVMRVLLLSKYGGTYLDLDVLSLVPLSVINRDSFACPEGKNIVTNAVINIGHKEHEVMKLYLEKLNSSYNPESWGANGPGMFTDSIRSFCKGTDLEKEKETHCGNFTVFPSIKCYPIEYGGYWLFYDEKSSKNVTQILTSTSPYFVHIWNKMLDFSNQQFKLVFNSTAPYIELGKNLCPQVMKTLERYFR